MVLGISLGIVQVVTRDLWQTGEVGLSVINVVDLAMLPGIVIKLGGRSAIAAIKKDILLEIAHRVIAKIKWNAINAMRLGTLRRNARVHF